jgi:hypothetical protein
VTEGTGHVIDPAGDASRALQAAVALHGPGVLGNAVMLDGFCAERLVGLTGEAVLISSAARSNVPALLRQQADSLSLDAAIASVADTVSRAHSLDDTACVWVVTEFARALGYPVPARARPMIVMPQPPTGPTQPMPPGGSGGFTDQGDALAPTLMAGGPAGSPPFGAGGSAALTQPYGATGQFGSPGPGGPAGPGGTPGGPAGPGGTPAGGPARNGIAANRTVLGVIVAIVLVAAFLGIASATHLSPFSKSSHTTPIRTPVPSSSDSSLGLAGRSERSVPSRGPDGARANPGAVTVTLESAGGPDLAAGAIPGWLYTTAQRSG